MAHLGWKLPKGFTLVELLVVIALVGIIAGIGSDIFFSILRSYNKANIITEIDQNGNLVINTISNELRSAKEISPSLGVGLTSLTIKSLDGGQITYSYVPPTAGPPPTNGYITRNGIPFTDNDFFTGVNVTDFNFSIRQTTSATTPPQVEIFLNIFQPVGAPGRVDYQADRNFVTTVGLRTY